VKVMAMGTSSGEIAIVHQIHIRMKIAENAVKGPSSNSDG